MEKIRKTLLPWKLSKKKRQIEKILFRKEYIFLTRVRKMLHNMGYVCSILSNYEGKYYMNCFYHFDLILLRKLINTILKQRDKNATFTLRLYTGCFIRHIFYFFKNSSLQN